MFLSKGRILHKRFLRSCKFRAKIGNDDFRLLFALRLQFRDYKKPINWSYAFVPILIAALFYLVFTLAKRKKKIGAPRIEY